MANKIEINTKQLEPIYEGRNQGPFSANAIDDYFLEKKRQNGKQENGYNPDFIFGHVNPKEEIGSSRKGYSFWTYFLEKGTKIGVITVIANGWPKKKNSVSVWYKGQKNIKQSFIEEMIEKYKQERTKELLEKKNELEREVLKLEKI